MIVGDQAEIKLVVRTIIRSKGFIHIINWYRLVGLYYEVTTVNRIILINCDYH